MKSQLQKPMPMKKNKGKKKPSFILTGPALVSPIKSYFLIYYFCHVVSDKQQPDTKFESH